MEQWEYTAKAMDMIFGALEKKEGIMIDPVERDLKEYLRAREKADDLRRHLEERYDSIRQNIKEQLLEICDLLNPFHSRSNKDNLELFADRLEEVAQMAREVSEEFK